MRETDFVKLDFVKKIALQTIVNKGYHGATISLIAKQAGVSDGYLYRHYSNKNELVIDLFKENMSQFLDFILKLISIEEKIAAILTKSFQYFKKLTSETPEITTFIFVMDHDHNFPFPESIKEKFLTIGENILKRGIQTGEINNKHTVENVLAVIFGIPVKMIEMRRKNLISNKDLDYDDIKTMTEICMKALL